MMEEIQLKLNEHSRGTFFIEDGGKRIAEMDIGIDAPNITVFHTGVEPEFEGRGIAKKLLTNLVQYAREHNLKVIALCKYVFVQFSRHPDEYQDVWNKNWKEE